MDLLPVLDHHAGGQRATDRDEANRRFRIGLLEPVATPLHVSKFWARGPAEIDQGRTGHCGGECAANEAQSSPFRVRGVDSGWGHAFYYEIKDRGWDPWGREDGTSTQAVMRLLVARGLAQSYGWAFNLDELRTGLDSGPELCGTTWMTGMFTPSADGIIHPTGVDEGGHLWLADGWYKNFRGRSGRTYGPCLRLLNSWSWGWGRGGRAVLPMDEAAHVIFDLNGEVGLPLTRTWPTV